MARLPEDEKSAYVSRRKSDHEEIENLRILAAKELSEQVKKLRMNSDENEENNDSLGIKKNIPASNNLKTQASKWTLEIAEARRACEASFRKAAGLGQIIVTAGYSGEIRLFENIRQGQLQSQIQSMDNVKLSQETEYLEQRLKILEKRQN